MQISIDRDRFLSLVTTAKSATNKRSTMPILASVYLKAEDGSLTVVGDDLGLRATASGEAKIQKPGAVCLDAENLHRLLSSFSAGEVSLSVNELYRTSLAVGENSQARLGGVNPQDYPAAKKIDHTTSAELPAEDIRAIFGAVLHATAKESLDKIFLTTVFLQQRENKLTSVGSDGHRMSAVLRELPAAETLGISAGLLLPRDAVQKMLQILDGAAGQVTVSIGWREEKQQTPLDLTLTVGESSITAKTLPSEYPDWLTLISRLDLTPRLDVPRAALIESAKRVAVISGLEVGKTQAGQIVEPRCQLTLEKGILWLSTETRDGLNKAEEQIPVTYQGKRRDLGVNVAYFLAALKAIDAENVTLAFPSAPNEPLLLTPAGSQTQICAISKMSR
jgi:DNA polymerase-3 subunit beta